MMLSFNQITFHYRRPKRLVLDNFSWQAPTGRTVLLGPNGAGKSTLLALGADALRPVHGQMCVGSLNAACRTNRAAYRRAVGWMPQSIRAVPGLTAREQVAYAGWLKGLSKASAWQASAAALAQVGLSELVDRKTSTLSGGQLRRVGLAQALVHGADVLLLDEPTVGLDPAQRSRFREILGALPSSHSVVVSTHQVDDLNELFDTVVVLDHGTIKFEGPVATFMALGSTTGERRAEAAYTSLVSKEH